MTPKQSRHVRAWYPVLIIGPGVLAVFVAITADFIGLGTPHSGLDPSQVVLLWLGIAAVFSGILIHRKAARDCQTHQRNYWKSVIFCCVPVLMIFFIGEVGTRVYLSFGETSLSSRQEFNQKWHSVVSSQFYKAYDGDYPYLPYRVRPQTGNDANSKGYRGPEFAWKTPGQTRRVACIGGSTTWEGTFPAALQSELNQRTRGAGHPFEVLNFGAESWTTVESLINLSVRGTHARPQYVVIYHAVNDLVAASHPKHLIPEPDYSHWRKRLKPPPSNTMSGLPLLFDQLAVVCLTRNILYRRQAEHTWANSICNYPFRGDYEFQGTETFRSNIQSMIAIAVQHGATVVLVTQVHSPVHSRKRCGNESGIQRVQMLNDVLREIATSHQASRRVILVDAAKEATSLKLYDEMHDWCHFSKAGYTRLGQFVAQQMMPD